MNAAIIAATRPPRRNERSLLGATLAASAAAHIVALLFIHFQVDVTPERPLLPPPPTLRIQPVMRAYDVVSVSVTVPSIDVQLRELGIIEAPMAPPQITAPGAPAGPSMPTAPPAAVSDATRGRLEYRHPTVGTVDVWRPPVEFTELSADALARERVAGRIAQFNDSVAAALGAAAKANDWTTRTADGGRWGVTADSIYIGDRAVRNFVQFAPPPGRREEIAGRVRTYGEIQYQINRIEGNDIINDRIKAIRARMDAERAKRNATTTGGTTGG